MRNHENDHFLKSDLFRWRDIKNEYFQESNSFSASDQNNYLLKNLYLYFEKWEDEIPGDIEPPAEAEEAPGVEPGGEEEFALQEALQYIDLENLVECLK